MANIITRLRELDGLASPPDWKVEEGTDPDGVGFRHISGWTDTGEDWNCVKSEDAYLTVEMRNHLPALLEYVERLERGITPPGHVLLPVEVAREWCEATAAIEPYVAPPPALAARHSEATQAMFAALKAK